MFSIFSKASWWELFETYLTHGEPLAAGFSILAKFAKTFSVNFCQIFHKRCGQICQQKFSANFGRPWAATKIWSCQNQICENKAVWERDEANPVCQISFEMIRGRANTHISVLYQANLICQISFETMEQIHTYIPPSPTFGLWKADVIKDYVALQFLPVC